VVTATDNSLLCKYDLGNKYFGFLSIPHSADMAGILLSVVKFGSQNAFGLKLCGLSVTAACQFYLN
jgi:hypothetical protein